MSTETATDTDTNTRTEPVGDAIAGAVPSASEAPAVADRAAGDRRLHWLSLGALAVLSWSWLGVLYNVVVIDGDPTLFLGVVAAAVAAGIVLGRVLPVSVAALATLVILVAASAVYVTTLPVGVSLVGRIDVIYKDVSALLTGLSILRIINAGLWATAVAPAPAFLSWYLAVRRRHTAAAVVGLAALSLFVLTGNADDLTTLLGAVAAAATVGLGDLAGRRATLPDAEAVIAVVAVMILLTASVSLVPGGVAAPLLPGSGGGGATTVEGSLTTTDDRVTIQGPLRLSPERRFTVQSEVPGYWRVGSYDRFTGSGWVRTGTAQASLSRPVRSDRVVEQTFTATTEVSVMPALWKPAAVEGRSFDATAFGGLRPTAPLGPGDSYTVRSRVSAPSPAELRTAGRDYPESVQRFLQLPTNTPDRIGTFTTQLTANADNAYDTARVIEVWLEQNKSYSLNVERPDGNIADAFLFEMDAGYCTYFATTMIVMLRSQGIPARFVSGYTTGEETDPGRYTVRGLNSHAWVEVYFPEHGWVRFDPTPAGPRRAAERSALEGTGVPIDGLDPINTTTPTTTDTPQGPQSSNETTTTTTTAPTGENGSNTPVGADGGGFEIPMPSREQAALGAVLLAGVVAGVRRSRAATRAYRAVWLRHQPRQGPRADVERAFARLEHLLRRERPRRPGETPRQYLTAVGDERAREVGAIYERAVYADRVTAADADRAVALVDELVGERAGANRLRERLSGVRGR